MSTGDLKKMAKDTDERKDRTLQIRITHSMDKKLKKIATKHGMKPPALVRHWVDLRLEKEKD
jgi:predicted DNA binding CopG/RHH family protein